MNGRFDWWCKTAVDQIRYGPDRDAVYQELYAHLEDRYEAELDHYDTPKEAEEAALRAMGSAAELAPQLAAVHRPFWGYVLTASRWILRLALVLLAVDLVAFLYLNQPNESYVPWFYEEPGTDVVRVWEDGKGEDRKLLDFDPDAWDRSDGFYFDVTRAVMTRSDHYTDDAEDAYYFWFQIEVSSLLQWAELEHIPIWQFRAVDSLGNEYICYDNNPYTNQLAVSGNLIRTGFFTYTMDLWLNNFCSEQAQWIDFIYDRNGRDIRLRIDLTGGETP